MKILDCTLRDGGYYNNWDFSPELIEAYLKAVSESKIDYVELGLRNFPQEKFLGAFAYTTEEYLNELHLPEGPIYGVMVDAKTILTSELGIENAIKKLFLPKSESKIGLIRVAAHFDEVEFSGPIVSLLKKMGYIVGFNLMQAGYKPDKTILNKITQVKSWKELDVLYFADSLGNMDHLEVNRIVDIIKSLWNGPIGIHTHNNMGKGLDNSISALNAGVSWLDSTITGMGRGAGNTQTESLLAVLASGEYDYIPEPIYDLVIRHFEPLQKDYGWGSNLLYFLGAQNDVHPTYIQNLLSNKHYGTDEVVGAIRYLSSLEGTTSYNGSIFDSALKFNNSVNEISGSKCLLNRFVGKEILIIANGDSTKYYKEAIELYIRVRKPIVLSLNLSKFIDSNLIDYFIISHNVKFLSDFKQYKNFKSSVILPKHRFSKDEIAELKHLDILDIGFDCSGQYLSYSETTVSSPYDLTSAFALGVASISSPSLISLVGFDGYEKGDDRQQEMLDIFNQYKKNQKIETRSLTPTSYNLKEGSIYALHS